MRNIFIFIVVFLMTILTGFAQKKTIVCFGNSLTYGFGLSEKETYPALINLKLQKAYPGKYKVINSGVNGETAAGGLKRLPALLDTLKGLDIFILELGVNDAIQQHQLQDVKAQLTSIIQKVKTNYPKVKIILAAVELPNEAGLDYQKQFKTMYAELSSEHHTLLIPSFLKNVLGDDSLTLEDGLHPNAEGMKIVAENIWPVLEQVR